MANIVVEATGAAINSSQGACAGGVTAGVVDASGPLGYLAEGVRTNLLLHRRKIAAGITATVWAATNVTAVDNATGADGVASACSTLTATGANGTVLQALTIASAAKAFSFLVKRKTGTGNVFITLDNDTTRTDITALINASTFTLIQATQTLANPTVGFKIATSGDEIIVDYGQLEDGVAFASSRIEGANQAISVQRNADMLTYPSAGNISGTQGSVYAEVKVSSLSGTQTFLSGGGTTQWYQSNAGNILVRDGTNIAQDGLLVAGTLSKVAMSYGGSSMRGVQNGTAGADATFDGDLGIGANFALGYDIAGVGNNLFGTIRNVRIWPTALPASKLQSITS